MTHSTADPDDPTLSPEDLLERAIRHCDTGIVLFQDVIDRARSGGTVSPAEIDKTARGLHAAVQTLITIRTRLDDARRELSVQDGGRALDLDAARDRIERLLDRLRAAGDEV